MTHGATVNKQTNISKALKLGDIYAQNSQKPTASTTWKAVVMANLIRLGIVGLGSAVFLLVAQN